MTQEAFEKAASQAGELKQDRVQLLASMEELVIFFSCSSITSTSISSSLSIVAVLSLPHMIFPGNDVKFLCLMF
jgi:hypothetical protein